MSVDFNTVQSGDVLTFSYRGQKDVSSRQRLVRVKTPVGPNKMLIAEDLQDGNPYKNFDLLSVSNAKVLGDKNTHVVTMQQVVDNFSKVSRKVQYGGLEAVAKELVPGAESVQLQKDLDMFLVKVAKPVQQPGFHVEVEIDPNTDSVVKTVLTWVNKNGEYFVLDFTGSQNGLLETERLVKALTKHFGV